MVPSLFLLVSCGAGRVLGEGQYALRRNEVKVEGRSGISTSELTPYIKQQPVTSILSNGFYNLAGHGTKWPSTMFRKIGTPPVVFDSTLMVESVKGITEHLEYLGYYGSKVGCRPEYKGKHAVKLVFSVVPGGRKAITDIRYNLPQDSLFRAEFAADTASSPVREGVFLSQDLLERESSRGSSYFRRRGYYDLNKTAYSFVADTLSEGIVSLEYNVGGESFRKYRISGIKASFPEDFRFSEKVIREMVTVHKGDLYNERSLNNTYSRLASVQAFSSVNVETTPSSDSTVECSISIVPAKLRGFKFRLEASVNSSGFFGISPNLDLFHRNIFHGGETLTIGFTGNFQFKFGDNSIRSNEFGVNAGLAFPKFIGLPMKYFHGPDLPRTEISIAYNYQNRPEFRRNLLAASFGYGGEVRKRFRYNVSPLRVNFVRLFDLDPDFSRNLDRNPFIKYAYQDHCDAGLSSSFIFATSPDLVPRTSFWSVRLGLDLSGNVLALFRGVMPKSESGQSLVLGSPFSQYVWSEISLNRTRFFGRDQNMSLACRLIAGAGFAYGNSTILPFEKQVYCGGANSMRGWQTRGLGPGFSQMNDSFSIPSQTGDIRLEANMEFRFRIYGKLEGAVFADAGNVWNWLEASEDPEHSTVFDRNFYKSIALDWGYGLRYNLNFLVLRLDMGHILHDPSKGASSAERWRGPSKWFRRDGFALQFGVGYPF